MNKTPMANRLHIAILGKRNAGKSSIINAMTNQDIAIVSSKKGTTTDPVYKTMELLPVGPVVIIDTAGIDDEGELGELRVKKTVAILEKTDLAILVVDEDRDLTFEESLIAKINHRNIPVIGVANKSDIHNIDITKLESKLEIPFIKVSASSKDGIEALKESIAHKAKYIDYEEPAIIGDLINRLDVIVHVIPIDKSAPKGRLILPQVQTIRDVLDHKGINIVVQDTELKETIEKFRNYIKVVVTDSQAFGRIKEMVPQDIYLTSYSILYARYKGELTELVKGAKEIKNLKDGDRVLICEACTHHRQEGDIGKEKIPKFLEEITSKKLNFDWSSGTTIPEDISSYKAIVHCGGCMLNRREMKNRINKAIKNNVPIINYGVFLGMKFNVLDRALDMFPEAKEVWEE